MFHLRRCVLVFGVVCLCAAVQRGWATVPGTATGPATNPLLLDESTLATRIDQHIDQRLAENGVIPAPQASDTEFLRRIYLDLIGRIPRVSEVRDFLADKSPDKRRRAVDQLLDSPHHAKHFATTWQSIITPTGNNQFQFGGNNGFKNWLENQVRGNVPYDQMVRDLITAGVGTPNQGNGRVLALGGLNQQSSPIAFLQANEFKPENMAAATTRLFLGVRLECAQCHDHPFASWKRKQFWEFAAFFAGVQQNRGGIRAVAPARFNAKQPPAPRFPRSIKIPMDNKEVEARFLNKDLPEWQDQVDSRITLADWVTSPKNPYFAQTGANRIWSHFFGIGINDPVDDEPTEENPISHPELLKELSQQFIAHKFDVKFMIRSIVASKAYQRTSAKTHTSQKDLRLFSRMPFKGMTPYQLYDSLVEATGYRDRNQTQFQPNPFGQSPRQEILNRFASTDKRTEMQTSILQALALMNGRFIADATSLQRSNTLAAVADAPFLNDAQKIETLFLATLSRLPRPEEAERLNSYVKNGGATNDSRAALADVYWALLNSSEFILNH